MIRFLIPLLLSSSLFAVSVDKIAQIFPDDAICCGQNADADIMLCLHGFGMDKRIASKVSKAGLTKEHVVSFNFPDHGETIYSSHPDDLRIGTLDELRPVIERLHTYVSEFGVEKLHLYGFSLGGGAAINVLAILKTHRFCEELGLTASEMDAIVAALEKGSIILCCPLKSIEEMIDEVDPFNPFLREKAELFQQNDFCPIDSLHKLRTSAFNILLCFANPDYIVSNRDDALFIERLQHANSKGVTLCVTCDRHRPITQPLLEGYLQLLAQSA